MKRTISILLAALLLVAALTGCGKKELEPRSFVDELLSGAKFTDSLSELPTAVVPILFGLDEADYTDAVVYAGTGATAETIAVFTASSDAAADRLLSAMRQYVDDQIRIYSSYGPAAAMTLENSVVTRSGDYVVVVVCSDNESAGKICEKYF